MTRDDPPQFLTAMRWAMPALVVHFYVAFFYPRVWSMAATAAPHAAYTAMSSVGGVHSTILLVTLILYRGSSAFVWSSDWSPDSPADGRAVSPGERGCILALLRLTLLVVMNWSTWKFAGAAIAL